MTVKHLILAGYGIIMYCLADSQSISLKGQVKDSAALGVDNASISLLRAKDSVVVKGTVTDKQGNYSFNTLKPGTYIILASKINFRKTFSKPIPVDSISSSVKADDLILFSSINTLQNVTVTAKRPLFEN